MSSYEKVAYYKVDTYEQAVINEAINKIFAELKLDELMNGVKNVVIKPNLVIKRPPEACATTHPSVFKAVVKALEEYQVNITVAESPGGIFNEPVMRALYKTTGYTAAAEGTDAVLNTDTAAVNIPSKRHEAVTEFNILKPLAQADLIINLAKLKTHSLTMLSAATKNMYGSIPGLQKFELHARFPDPVRFAAMVVELTETLAPSVNIVEGVYGMEGNGPNNGDITEYNAIFASRSPFCCDVVCADYLCLPKDSVPMLNIAKERGLCPDTVTEIELTGDTDCYEKQRIKTLKLPDTQNGSVITRLSKVADGRVTRLFEPHPVVTKTCRGCGECVMYCPMKTISMVDKRAKIDREKCIKCFCCQELCHFNAIKIKRVGILKL